RWVVKVNRLITHQSKFSDRAIETWKKFQGLFLPMVEMIDFFLFQLPPNLTPQARNKIETFLVRTGINEQCALEPRHTAWFSDEVYQWAKDLKITWVSIDAPEFSRDIIKTTDTVYLRMHGRTGWYYHNYSPSELKEIARRILATRPGRIYIFFNNNHNMLKNAQMMEKILSGRTR
ncbi:MAG: DUF72 domain-containing protein, partial [candidate division WOR-3 bacterium]